MFWQEGMIFVPTNKPLFRVTPSNINDLDCPKKFHVLRELGQWPTQANNQGAKFGLAFHQVIRDVYDPKNGAPPNLEHLEFYVKRAFVAVRYSNPTARQEDMDRCIKMACTYVANDDEEDIRGTIAVERFGSFTLHHNNKPLCIISARLDRVIVRANDLDQLVIRDCKTSRPWVDLKGAFIQLWVTKHLFPKHDRYVLEYDWIDAEGRVERDVITSADLKGVRFLTTSQVLAYASRADYPAEPGELCTLCPLRTECQPQQIVSLEEAQGLFSDEE